MDSKNWKSRLNLFILPHPEFKNTEEEIFTPKEGLKIKFWFDGNIQIEGVHPELEINFNDPALLILARKINGIESIFRIPWERLVSFELIREGRINNEVEKLLRIKPEQIN